jgi:hypothetical protein
MAEGCRGRLSYSYITATPLDVEEWSVRTGVLLVLLLPVLVVSKVYLLVNRIQLREDTIYR